MVMIITLKEPLGDLPEAVICCAWILPLHLFVFGFFSVFFLGSSLGCGGSF